MIHDLRAVAVACILIVAIGILVYAQFHRQNPFDFWDLLMDPTTNRASMDSVVTLVCCAVGVWYAISKATDAAFDLSGGAGSFLLQLIGIMVVYRGAKTGIHAWRERPPSPPPSGPDVGQQVTVVTPGAQTDVVPSGKATQ